MTDRTGMATATNGVITAPPKGVVGGNRKKQKRRAKQAARQAAQPPLPAQGQPPDLDYGEEDAMGYGDEDDYYSDDQADQYNQQYASHPNGPNGYDAHPPPPAKRNKKKKKGSVGHHDAYDPGMLPPLPPLPPHSSGPLRPLHRNSSHRHDPIWNTSTAQERQNIKEFWLSLNEHERKSLLKIEKEAVLRKMKQQQKHSCSCTVCGRKRTAIEDELEVLYEGYYEELEQYAHHDHPPLPSADGLMPDPLQHRKLPPMAVPPPIRPLSHHRTSHITEHFDDNEFSEGEEDEDEDDVEDDLDDIDESYGEEDYREQGMLESSRVGVPDFFNFGQNLTVKGILTPWLEKLQQGLKGKADNLLTVADDLLKNDGRKFIEMMEQLAERRMQRENEAEYAAANPSHPGGYPADPAGYHEDSLAVGDEYDDDEEASYDSQEEYDDDELDEESEGLTEEQRMQEGRRMFQIFAARMFEQRVLNAYREKVAAERQAKLLEELQDEDKQQAEREAKRQRDAAKKKEKKKQQQQAKAEEKARKDAEKAAEEARIREAEEKKAEEQRRRKEEQRKRREDEKRKQDEEKARKNAERARQLAEEQQRREEAERKAREAKAAEKAKKEEQRKREREEREAKEKEARDRKAQEERERKEREAKAKAEKEAKEREKAAQQAANPPQQPPQIAKRPSQAGMVAVPGVYPKQTPPGISSPHPAIATPAIPKAPAPGKQRQASHQGSHASSPKQAQSQVSSAPSKSSSPGNAPTPQQQVATQPKTIMQKPPTQNAGPPQHPMQSISPLPQQQPMQPPPGMQHGPHHPGQFGGMSPMGFAGFQGPQGPMMHNQIGPRGPMMPMYQQHNGPPMGVPNRMAFSPGHPGMPPPGMMAPHHRGFPFDAPTNGPAPPGFQPHQQPPSHTSPMGQPPLHPTPGSEPPSRPEMPGHSRQQSASDKDRFESAANQPIARPAPIQRPSSVKPQSDNSDVEDLSKHLGSSALLADDDEPLPGSNDTRRHSGLQGSIRGMPPGGISGLPGFGPQQPAPFGTPVGSWTTPTLPFGQGSGLGQQNWGSLPTPGLSNWQQNQAAFSANAAFGPIGGMQSHHRPTGGSLNRPLTIRLAVCQACKQLSSAARGETDGYHDISTLMRQIDSNRPLLDSPPTLGEIEEICETEGDSQNGGGELHLRRSSGSAGEGAFAVKWEPDAGTPEQGGRGGSIGLGEIGSPMPSKSSPAFGPPGMGRAMSGVGAGPFQSLGQVGSPGF